MAITLIVLGFCLTLMGGCSTTAITEGFHKTLPQQNTRVLVWGGHPSASRMAELWLQKRGMTTLDQTRVQQIINEQHSASKDSLQDEKLLLQIGKLVRVGFVVIVHTPFTKGEPGAPYIGPYGGGTMERVEYIASVSIKGVSVETGETAWSGSARYPGSYEDLDKGLKELTCQALATAWGIRPIGHYPIKSQAMCEVTDPGTR